MIRGAVEVFGLPADAVQLVPGDTHESVKALMRARGLVDVLDPARRRRADPLGRRGVDRPGHRDRGRQLPRLRRPAADLEQALAIVLNSKTQRTSVCNAAESLLVHADVADAFLPQVVAALQDAGRHHPRRRGVRGVRRGGRRRPTTTGRPSTSTSTSRPPSSPTSTPRSSTSAAGRAGHTEAIVTGDLAAARRFAAEVDAAAVLVNASTRFTDGGEFGFGAEIGISTQKLHARGPMGLTEMTSTKYVVTGDGHVR